MQKEIEQSIYELISKFVSRQSLVFQAVKELRPHILVSTGAISGENIKNTSRFDIPQTGIWGANQDWKYFLHGLGCKLIHTETQEPIEWNAPNPNAFDKFWFANWLKWYLIHFPEMQDMRSKSMNSEEQK